MLPGGQRLTVPGCAMALRVAGSRRPQHGERARRQIAVGQFAEPGDLGGRARAGSPTADSGPAAFPVMPLPVTLASSGGGARVEIPATLAEPVLRSHRGGPPPRCKLLAPPGLAELGS